MFIAEASSGLRSQTAGWDTAAQLMTAWYPPSEAEAAKQLVNPSPVARSAYL